MVFFWFDLSIVHAAMVYKLLAVCLQTGHATTSLACPPKSIWILRRFLYPAPNDAIYQCNAWLTSRLKTTQPDS